MKRESFDRGGVPLLVALVLFAVAALGGLSMAIMRFGGRPLPPLALALAHGAAAAAGLVALVVAVAGGDGSGPATLALVLMVAAALGGFVLFARHLKKQALPINLMVVHALVAVAGFVALLVAFLG